MWGGGSGGRRWQRGLDCLHAARDFLFGSLTYSQGNMLSVDLAILNEDEICGALPAETPVLHEVVEGNIRGKNPNPQR